MVVISSSVITSGIKEIAALPVSWFVKRQGQSFYQLDLKNCNIASISDQVSPHFMSQAEKLKAKVSLNQDEDRSSNTKSKFSSDVDKVLSQSELILKLGVPLNEIHQVTAEDLFAFPEVRSLDLSLNAIQNFKGIAACVKLVVLNLSYNDISVLPNEALAECIHLQNMDLSANKLSSLVGFPNLPNLIRLNLRNNKLEDLQGLQILRSLRQVDASKNKLRTIIHICPCLELTELILSDNYLSNISDVVSAISPLSRLKQMSLKGNPVSCSNSDIGLHSIFTSDTAVELLDGVNIRPPKVQFRNFSHLQPPNPLDDLKVKLKNAVKESLEEGRERKRKKIHESIDFLHKKILMLREELEEYENSSVVDADAWCKYIDTLTTEEARSLTLSQIRASALAGADGQMPIQMSNQQSHKESPNRTMPQAKNKS